MSLARASAVIATGTLVSRVTGLLRTVVLVTAIGAIGTASDAFATANQLPNSILTLVSTGLLTAVIVPRVVAVSAQPDAGRTFLPKLFTLGAAILAVTTLIAMAAAPALIWVFAPNFSDEQRALATAFAYWCLPQVFFYGMFALLGEALNARRIFAPYAWAPIVNNVVSIAGFVVFIAAFGSNRNELEGWDAASVALLAGTATAGIVAQALVLLLFWARSGVPLRLDFRWRGTGLGDLRGVASWTFGMVLVTLGAGIVQQQTISAASGDAASVAVWQNAWLIYMVPYSLIVLAIGTPYFTQISEHAAARRDSAVLGDIDRSIRILGLFVTVAAAALMAAAVPASRIFTNSTADALAAAPVLIAFLFALVPMAVLFIIQRTFYAYGDTRTPFLFTAIQGAAVVALTISAGLLVSDARLTAVVAGIQTLCGTAELVLATVLLRRILGPLGLGRAWTTLGRFVLAAVPAAAAGWGVYLLTGAADGWMVADKLWGALGTVLVGAVSGAVYLSLLALLRTPELTTAVAVLRSRFGPRPG